MNIEQTEEYQQLCECYGVEYAEYCNKNCDECSNDCLNYKESERCREYERLYPSFTPQKQLSLWKLCIDTHKEELHTFRAGEKYLTYYHFEKSGYSEFSIGDTYEQMLCNLLFDLKNVLDHAKVKEILEG